MRQGNSNKRMRGRGGSNNGGGGGGGGGNSGGGNNNGRKGPNPLSRSYESTGPDVKIRGTALHIAEKYVALARDAHSSGDPVLAENYLQHAEHYYRIIAAAQASMPQPVAIVRSDIQDDDDEETDGYQEARVEQRVAEPRGDLRNETRNDARPVSDDGFMPADAPQPFVDEIPGVDRGDRPQGDRRPQGERRGRFLRSGPRSDGNRYEGNRPERNDRPERVERPVERPERAERVERPERAERPERVERAERVERPERSESRPVRERPARAEAVDREPTLPDLDALPAFLTAAPARIASTPATPVVASEDVAAEEETPRRRTRGGRGRGRRPEYEGGETAGEAPAPAEAPVATVED